MANGCGDARYCSSFYAPTFSERTVKVNWVSDTFTDLKLTWPAQPNATGGYNVYGSPSPTTKNLLTETPIAATEYQYQAPAVPEDITWHFWVSSIDPFGNETFIEAEPATLRTNSNPFSDENSPLTTEFTQAQIPNDAMAFYFDEIRRRHQALLEADGEDFTLYLRKWSGQACPTTDARVKDDPDYDANTLCKICFGTGILGGYWPSIQIKMRYGEAPPRKITYTDRGLELTHDFNSWTLWLPRLHEHDLLVRNLTGERFEIENAAESAWRGLPLRQQGRLLLLQPGDIRHLVSDAAIADALTHHNDPYAQPSIWG